MNTLSQLVMSGGYLFFISSVLPNVRAVWQNRRKLSGFSRFGVTATLCGLLLVQTSFIIDGAWIPLLIGVPNLGYWIMLCWFVWRG